MSSEFSNHLTPAEVERLAVIIEECGEVIQAATKVLRHGYEFHHPETGVPNRAALRREIIDLLAVLSIASRFGDHQIIVDEEIDDVIDRKQRWLHYNRIVRTGGDGDE